VSIAKRETLARDCEREPRETEVLGYDEAEAVVDRAPVTIS
jgi:hypothetical protein